MFSPHAKTHVVGRAMLAILATFLSAAEFQSDTGDFEGGFGTAVVLVAFRHCGRTLQFSSRRQADGEWRIVAVNSGR